MMRRDASPDRKQQQTKSEATGPPQSHRQALKEAEASTTGHLEGMSSGASSPEIVQNPEAEGVEPQDPAGVHVPNVETASVEERGSDQPAVQVPLRDQPTRPRARGQPRDTGDEVGLDSRPTERIHQGEIARESGPTSARRAREPAAPNIAALHLGEDEDEVSEIQPRPLRRPSQELNISGLTR